MTDLPLSRYRYVFLCGAKRSGTTILTALLDGHHELFVFPGEFQVFGPGALGRFDPDEELPVERFLEAIDWYLAALRAERNEAHQASFDVDEVVDRLKRKCQPMRRMTFLDELASACIEASGAEPPRYVVIKTMFNGVDFEDPEVFRHFKVVTTRDPRELLLSYRTKFLRQPTFYRYQAIGNLFSFNYRKARAQRRVLRDCALAGSFCELSLAALKKFPEESMRRLCRELDVEFDPTLIQPTFGGKPFSGHFYDPGKNVGAVLDQSSSHFPLMPAEAWAAETLEAPAPIRDRFRYRLGAGLPAAYASTLFVRYLGAGGWNLVQCFADIAGKTLHRASSGDVKALATFPFHLGAATYHHVAFFFTILAAKNDQLVSKEVGWDVVETGPRQNG